MPWLHSHIWVRDTCIGDHRLNTIQFASRLSCSQVFGLFELTINGTWPVGFRKTKIIVVASILILGLGALGRGNWAHQVASLGALLWLGVPLLIAALVLTVSRRVRGALYCVGAVGSIALQLGFGMAFLSWDIYRSQRYCESLVPILDEIYRVERQYPLTMEAEPLLPAPPPWQFDTGLINYYSNGASFTFEVTNPAELFGGFTYRHDARRWEKWRD